ncbi:MAG: hypothetical protein ACOYK6_05420 [Chthoniobacterales bacterium]
MTRQLVLHWEADFFSLAQFSRDKDGQYILERGATHHRTQKKNKCHLVEELHPLQATLRSWEVHQASLHCLLPANRVFLRTVKLEIPSGLKDAIPRLVALEAKHIFPLPLEELIWSFQIFPSVEREQINVAYSATKNNFLEPLLEIISKTEISGLTIATISAAPASICEALRLIDQSKEASLILEAHASFTNVILIKPNTILSSYTLASLQQGGEKVNRSSREKISTDLLQILEHATSERWIPEKIFVSGRSADKHHLLPFLQERLKIPTCDLDTLLKEKISLGPAASEFLENDCHFSWSYLVGATTLFQKEPALDLRPPSLRIKKHAKEQRPYLLCAIVLLACTLLVWSLYLHYETHRFITATSQACAFLGREQKRLAESDKELAHFQKIEETKETLYHLIEARAHWPQLIQELQNALPTRYLWITKLSPITDEKNDERNFSVTALAIEGLYLENPRQAAVVHDFIANLKKSAFFSIQDQEEILLFCSSADGTAYAYPFKMRLTLRNPLIFTL